ncbi:MAG: class IV adenylate cyclase [Pyrinomonadaceae bacterium]
MSIQKFEIKGMRKNIELKAKAYDFKLQLKAANELADKIGGVLIQKDTIYNSSNGRLKLREFSGNTAELIFYKRVDKTDSKLCEYLITSITDAASTNEILSAALGTIGEVEKHRTLLFCGQTRIHFDRVKSLGEFIEFEYVLETDEPEENGRVALETLKNKLNIEPSMLINCAYIDLITAR